MDGDVEQRRMQVKVLYSFNDNPTVFLSRSSGMHNVRVAEIPTNTMVDELIMLGGFDLKHCIKQIITSSPENFHLQTHDYAVYYKDLTEQPDEPFVSHGIFSELLQDSESTLIPGRVCQNVSANFLFGKKSDSSSLTLEIRLKLHTIEREHSSASATPKISQQQSQSQQQQSKRSAEVDLSNEYRQQKAQRSSYTAPVKATRTKSLPAFPQIYNNHMYSIRNADKLNTPSKYDPQSVLDRFKSASFVDAQVIAKPKVLRRRKQSYQNQVRGYASGASGASVATRSNSMIEPMRAMRTRSMVTNRHTPLMISSPIHEEGSSDTDDTEYNENSAQTVDAEDEDDEDDIEDAVEADNSPYTPQQPPYKPSNDRKHGFHSLPDLEDLDSKKTHTIPGTKLPENHGLLCVNPNCVTEESITWRYFEMNFHPNYFEIRNSKEFNKKNYEGMFGPLCNACYLFLRNKGFMRPEAVVKKYLKQQKYKRELKEREEREGQEEDKVDKGDEEFRFHDKHFQAPNRRPGQIASSPMVSMASHKFATPSHTPSEINQVIQNTRFGTQNDLSDFINQLNNFGGPLTDIDPLPQDLQDVTPPMMATKSNTRVINIDQGSDDKENCPPIDVTQFHNSSSPARNGTDDFEKMIIRSFNHAPPTQRSSPIDHHNEWMNSLFGENPTPKDQVTPLDTSMSKHESNNDTIPSKSGSNVRDSKGSKVHPGLPQMKTFSTRRSPRLNKTKSVTTTMPSSPLLATKSSSDDKLDTFLDEASLEIIEDEIRNLHKHHPNYKSDSPQPEATRNDTTNSVLSLYQNKRLGTHSSSPGSEIFSDDIHQKSHSQQVQSREQHLEYSKKSNRINQQQSK
ncbi:hypothetical protein PSN45_003201 [Yamadazyma tenuis]|uniref:GATA-type domain-containing protein n=1 Tax=Candida tenuis (strain ATCC 10573 / BCRC 21748 / CBS 615 / JCM 9827 / NBRC 10315 / NRRL Y-1498 / VKM Y-70) TaxID=590646 RepID=G3AZ18_CANTC|nr:uncharacterized protein CANTEDRAFT_118998 [Yamadazyma tenuis ATCC 10573]EGV65983.1 hypothetical protein CANTEDRAFT_118998 [Yamadazyma tenuis ATCC 10573]WEJ95677.1 hypothetical protein PSN45_003201 [Yamadazyma tenuis]